MKHYKKILLGLVPIIGVVSGILLSNVHAFAATQTPTIVAGSDFVFTDKSTITGTVVFTDANGVQTNVPLTFYDSNVTDTTYNYGKITGLPATLCVSKLSNPGINLTLPGNFTASSIPGILNIGYWVGVGGAATCKQPSALGVDVTNTNSAATNDYTYTSPTSIEPVNGTGYPLNQGPFVLANGTSNIYAMLLGGGRQCKYSWIIAVDPNDPTTGKLYDITPNKSGAAPIDAGDPDLGTVPGPTTTSNCYVIGSAKTINIGGTAPVINPNPSCSNGFQNPPKCNACSDGTTKLPCSTPPPVATSCEAQDPWSLGWLMCPTLRYIEGTVNALDGVINDQLCFPSAGIDGGSTSAGKYICKGAPLLTAQTKDAWASLKNIATAILVIAMLVMVIAQAFGGGPFDAYTVRKLLPRLVAIAIAMQLSWFIAKWFIDVTNDIGSGISSLIYGAFNLPIPLGPTLDKLLGANFFSVGALAVTAGAVILGGIMIFTTLALAVPVIIGVIVALLVLVLRKVLILLCVILMPVALAAYILPGTQKYYKLWWETFSKMLIMFPMIMGMIAVGRVFASISKGGSQSSSLPFTVFILVLVGYFGPYFFLPKTLKWGGQALGAMGGALNNIGQKAGTPVTKKLGEMNARSRWTQARAARKGDLDRQAKIGFAEGLQGRGIRASLNRARLVGLGTPRGEARLINRVQRSAAHVGEEEAAKQAQERVARILEEGDTVANGTVTDRLEALGTNTQSTHAEQEAAISQLVTNRQFGAAERIRATNPEAWDRSLRKNGALFGQVSELRSDLTTPNAGRTTAQTFAGNFDPTGAPVAGQPGLGVSSLATQHHTFFGNAATEFTAMAAGPGPISPADRAALDGAYDRIVQLAHDPARARQILGTDSEGHIDRILQAHGGGVTRFRDLVP